MATTKNESKSSDSGISETFPIQVLCDFIKTYKGERDTLTAFLTNCQNALSLASRAQKDLLLKFIISKLEGKAQIACSNRIFENFDDLKDFLKQNFGERKHYNHLLLELQTCRQQTGETVSQFSLRIESCVAALLSEIHSSETLKKDLPGRVAMTEDLALHTFIIGLQPQLSALVRTRDIRNLNAAVNVAMSEEKINNFLSKPETKVGRPLCKRCGKAGHSETQCYFRQNSQAVVPHQQPRTPQYRQYSNQQQASTSGQPQSGQQQSGQPIVCRYCKSIGHDIHQCIKRRINNSRRGVHYTQPLVESPPESPLPTAESENQQDLN